MSLVSTRFARRCGWHYHYKVCVLIPMMSLDMLMDQFAPFL